MILKGGRARRSGGADGSQPRLEARLQPRASEKRPRRRGAPCGGRRRHKGSWFGPRRSATARLHHATHPGNATAEVHERAADGGAEVAGQQVVSGHQEARTMQRREAAQWSRPNY